MNSKSYIEALEDYVTGRLMETRVSLPAVVESYDSESRSIQARPLIKVKYTDGQELEFPLINDVPVVFPRTQDFIFSFPLRKGDGVTLLVSDHALETWKGSKGQEPAGYDDPRLHNITDAVAIPGLFPLSASNPGTDPDSVQIVFKEAEVTIKPTGDVTIKSPTKVIIDAPQAELTGGGHYLLTDGFMQNLFLTHTHPTAAPGPPSPPTPIVLPPQQYQTIKTKAE